MQIGVGALKPNKVRQHKTSKHAGGHMPAGMGDRMAHNGKSNHHYDGKGDLLG